MALQLHAVTPTDAGAGPLTLPAGVRPVIFRDLSAIVSDRERFALPDDDAGLVHEHRAIVDAVFKRQVVLPGPPGVIFRTEHVLTRWLELHYVALSDAMAFVLDRAVGRVHVQRSGGAIEDSDAGSDLAEAAGDIFRNLRRRAVASVPLSVEKVTGITLSNAFLVERELWKEFERGVAEAKEANPKTSIELTGPWAPYDFVHMQFGD